MQRNQRNLGLLMNAAERLESMLSEFVFLGGSTTVLLITDPAAPEVRATMDVDVIVEVQHHGEYAAIERRMRELGFGQSLTGDQAVICRWHRDDLVVDVMPTDERILGFSNPWYPGAIATAVSNELPNGYTIRHVTAPYFVATKLAAFDGRGEGDYLASPDFEDLIAVIDGRENLPEEINLAPMALRRFVVERFSAHLRADRFHQALHGLVIDAGESPSRVAVVERTISRICESR